MWSVIQMSTRESMLLDAIGDRFEVLLRRYDLFAQETPARFERWLAGAQKLSTLESVCLDLFPDLLTSDDAPRRWMLAVSMVALKHHVAQLSCVELSPCGQALRVEGEAVTPAKSPVESEPIILATPTVKSEPVTLANAESEPVSLAKAPATRAPAVLLKQLSYISALEVRVAELECRLHHKTSGSSAPVTKRSKPSLPDTPEQAIAFLCERRAEALDALLALRGARKKLPDSPIEPPKAVKPPLEPILPKRALSLAGYWNIMPNDLLAVTPALIEAIEQRGGTVIRREGMHVCFSLKEQALVTSVVLEVMERLMPHYKRREED